MAKLDKEFDAERVIFRHKVSTDINAAAATLRLVAYCLTNEKPIPKPILDHIIYAFKNVSFISQKEAKCSPDKAKIIEEKKTKRNKTLLRNLGLVWTRKPRKLKSLSIGRELHFTMLENGCRQKDAIDILLKKYPELTEGATKSNTSITDSYRTYRDISASTDLQSLLETYDITFEYGVNFIAHVYSLGKKAKVWFAASEEVYLLLRNTELELQEALDEITKKYSFEGEEKNNFSAHIELERSLPKTKEEFGGAVDLIANKYSLRDNQKAALYRKYEQYF